MNWQSIYSGPLTPELLGGAGILLALVVLWSLVWKGMALWKAAKQGSKVWFVILLVVNTIGILEILYLYVFSKRSGSATQMPSQSFTQ